MKKILFILLVTVIGCNTPKKTEKNNFYGFGQVQRYKVDKNGVIIKGKGVDIKQDSLGRIIIINTDTLNTDPIIDTTKFL